MSEIIDALNQLEREKSVSKELVMEAIEKSLVAACEKDYGKNVLVEAHMDRLLHLYQEGSCRGSRE